VANWRNASGRPLASPEWLEAHHLAKLPERRRFAERLAALCPARIVDLGCGTGLWLDLLNEVLSDDCEFIGLDSDPDAAALACTRCARWQRPVVIRQLEIEAESRSIPACDLALAFNVFPYLEDPAAVIAELARKGTALAVRQYDGAALRFGPMGNQLRTAVETSLQAAVGASEQFRHYDMDRVFSTLTSAAYTERTFEFELFARTDPFPPEFLDYYEGMMGWTLELLSEDAASAMRSWLADPNVGGRYFFEVDLTAVLS
jgi:SAM-dependent methyltransferase